MSLWKKSNGGGTATGGNGKRPVIKSLAANPGADHPPQSGSTLGSGTISQINGKVVELSSERAHENSRDFKDADGCLRRSRRAPDALAPI